MLTRQPLASLAICLISVTVAGLGSGCRSAQSSPAENPPERTPVASATDSSTAALVATAGAVKTVAPNEVDARSEPLTLATWNLEWLSEEIGLGPVARSSVAFARLGKYAQRLNADVIAVQEVESTTALERVFDPARYAFHVTADASPQRTGFVYDKRLQVVIHPDYTALSAGRLRSGADLGIYWNGQWLRLLSVHLKSGCFDQPLDHDDACRKLHAQVPKLEAWIDARASERTPFAVLGDFNRRLFAASDDPVWSALDDSQPPESDLTAPTQGARSQCWLGQRPQFIDHIVLSRTLSTLLISDSFTQQLYDATDARHRKQLSDHCPITVRLSKTPPPRSPAATPHAAPSAPTPSTPAATPMLVKGNRTRKGKLYYHTQGCPQYARVKVDEAKGERSFADEVSARAAGYQRSPDCPNYARER